MKFDGSMERVAKQNADIGATLKTLQAEATSIGTGS